MERAGLEGDKRLSGPQGGDAQIASRLAEGQVEMVIFFREPLGKQAQEPDVNRLMRLCDVHNIHLSTNPAAGRLFLDGLVDQMEA